MNNDKTQKMYVVSTNVHQTKIYTILCIGMKCINTKQKCISNRNVHNPIHKYEMQKCKNSRSVVSLL